MYTPFRLRTVSYQHELDKIILFRRGHSLEDLQILRQYVYLIVDQFYAASD
jgi:hypothetical protein